MREAVVEQTHNLPRSYVVSNPRGVFKRTIKFVYLLPPVPETRSILTEPLKNKDQQTNENGYESENADPMQDQGLRQSKCQIHPPIRLHLYGKM